MGAGGVGEEGDGGTGFQFSCSHAFQDYSRLEEAHLPGRSMREDAGAVPTNLMNGSSWTESHHYQRTQQRALVDLSCHPQHKQNPP